MSVPKLEVEVALEFFTGSGAETPAETYHEEIVSKHRMLKKITDSFSFIL